MTLLEQELQELISMWGDDRMTRSFHESSSEYRLSLRLLWKHYTVNPGEGSWGVAPKWEDPWRKCIRAVNLPIPDGGWTREKIDALCAGVEPLPHY